ncbi:MAG: hypothetical protein COU07_02230 [Candidatus Harrisonbacteria bacterium CG10_big_fil_rev_8_21_14_0_10_40_38]|uniref:dolichyl-phosphate beta-glucosyltransferase n=1 Tax=Candidatus Harrisonbacteria bacterium CG10_big_fil_rev_8_21_14_0_10_40_38 TaxID=1974583 RepID=A0A2H0US88_9BACT|nr:MAG: hypothetical protein COU07_02230 [Candidatus Harrisonbacteria bacterium CG10_big_fil_rev_8_21_14_0_10_40_38]
MFRSILLCDMQSARFSISIVVPAYNEAKRIEPTLRVAIGFLSGLNLEYEIIVVDDGSKDDTVDVVKNIGDAHIIIATGEPNRGKGYAVRRGMLMAKNDYVLMTDADNSTPIEEFKKFYDVLPADIVIGSRAISGSEIEVRQPLYREYAGKFFNFVVQMLVFRGISDTQCGFKMFSREAARNIFSRTTIYGWSFDVEVLYLAKKLGYSVKQIPVIWRNDKDTKLKFFSTAFAIMRDLIKIRINNLRGVYSSTSKR